MHLHQTAGASQQKTLPFRQCKQSNVKALRSKRVGKRENNGRNLGVRTCAVKEQVELLQATIYGQSARRADRKLLVYFPGTDGTGNAISPQLPGLLAAGFDVRALYIPPSDRSDWQALTNEAIVVIRKLINSQDSQKKVTLVAESFGGCLALRVAREAPQLLERMVLVNPATSFGSSWGGIPSLAASTRLLSVFPKPLYQVAQAVLLPFLVDQDNVGKIGIQAVKQMIDMSPPSNKNEAELKSKAVSVSDPTPPILQQFESHEPAAAGSWRLALLCNGNVSDQHLSSIRTPTLLISSAKDKLLNSLEEGSRLERNLGNAMRVVLPKSGHTALLEDEVHLIDIMRSANFLPGDLADASEQYDFEGTPRRRTGNETEPLQRNTRRYSLNAIKRKEPKEGAQLGSPLVPGLNWSRKAVASPSVAESHQNGSDLSQRPARVLTTLQENGLQETGSYNGQTQNYRNGNSSNGASRQTSNGSGNISSNGQMAVNGVSQSGSRNMQSSSDPRTQNGATVLPVKDIKNGSSQQRPNRNVFPRDLSQSDNSSPTDYSRQRSNRNDRESQGQSNSEDQRGSLGQQKEALWGRPDPRFDQAIRLFNPIRELISPVMRGLENLPSASDTQRPLLFVGNHARIGLYDMPYLIMELYLRRIKLRGLAHPGHWKAPTGAFFEFFGAVKATPRSAYKLLKSGEAVLLFPGGGREVNKRKGEEYQLFWPEEPDFVRLAAKHDALIIPFASVGGDEAFDLALDSDEVMQNPILGNLATNMLKGQLGDDIPLSEAVPPVTKLPGLGIPSILPVANLSRLYFRFMPAIDLREGDDIVKDKEAASKRYEQVKQQVYEGIHQLKEEQRSDPNNSLGARVRTQIGRFLPAFDVLK